MVGTYVMKMPSVHQPFSCLQKQLQTASFTAPCLPPIPALIPFVLVIHLQDARFYLLQYFLRIAMPVLSSQKDITQMFGHKPLVCAEHLVEGVRIVFDDISFILFAFTKRYISCRHLKKITIYQYQHQLAYIQSNYVIFGCIAGLA